MALSGWPVATTMLHYAFHAARASADADSALAVAAVTLARTRATPAPLSGQDAARQRALAAAARRALVGLVEVGHGDRRRNAIELVLPPTRRGEAALRLAVHADQADVVLSVSRHDPRLRDAFERTWTLLRALAAAGLVVHDPQRNRLVDLGRDLDPTVAQFQEVAPASPRPWWRVW